MKRLIQLLSRSGVRIKEYDSKQIIADYAYKPELKDGSMSGNILYMFLENGGIQICIDFNLTVEINFLAENALCDLLIFSVPILLYRHKIINCGMINLRLSGQKPCL